MAIEDARLRQISSKGLCAVVSGETFGAYTDQDIRDIAEALYELLAFRATEAAKQDK